MFWTPNGLEVQLCDHRIVAEGIGRRRVRRGHSGVGDGVVGGDDVEVALNLSSQVMEGVYGGELALPSECSRTGTLHGHGGLGLAAIKSASVEAAPSVRTGQPTTGAKAAAGCSDSGMPRPV